MSDVDDGKILKLFVDGDCLNFNSQKIQSFCLNWEEEKKMATIFKISPQIYFVSLLKKHQLFRIIWRFTNNYSDEKQKQQKIYNYFKEKRSSSENK